MQSPEGGISPALKAVYEQDEPGATISLYSGPLAVVDGMTIDGEVALRCSPDVRLVWRLDADEHVRLPGTLSLHPLDLEVHHVTGVRPVMGQRYNMNEGWLERLDLGESGGRLDRIIAHWFNLPDIHTPELIVYGDGWQGNGRWQVTVEGWTLTIDQQRQHREIWDSVKRDRTVAMTHTMEIRREDGSSFTANDGDTVLSALQHSLSFALGRWVAPALPVGFDASGHCVWESWGSILCQPGANGLAWWYYGYPEDLEDLLRAAIRKFVDADEQYIVRVAMAGAVQANVTGFVEQRVMTAFSMLELLIWSRLVIDGQMTKSSYDRLGAGDRLRIVLERINAHLEVDRERLPALATYASELAAGGRVLDGPAIIARIRNHIVHPKNPRGDLYHIPGLVRDAWFLAHHYLTLLILNRIGYSGTLQENIGPGGWEGETVPVPWRDQDSRP